MRLIYRVKLHVVVEAVRLNNTNNRGYMRKAWSDYDINEQVKTKLEVGDKFTATSYTPDEVDSYSIELTIIEVNPSDSKFSDSYDKPTYKAADEDGNVYFITHSYVEHCLKV